MSATLGSNGTTIFGEVAGWAWGEARSSFVNGNYLATVLVCQAMAEQMLASYLTMQLIPEPLPRRVAFRDTLSRCEAQGIISAADARDFQRMADLRNPLSHYRHIDDLTNLTRRGINDQLGSDEQLRRDATFAIGMAVRLLALPPFRIDG